MLNTNLGLIRISSTNAMAHLRCLLLASLVLIYFAEYQCKIVLPHKLRYLENMLNAEVVAKAAKIRQQMEANPNIQDSDKGWPLLLSKLQADDKSAKNYAYNGYGNFRRLPNFK